MFLEKFQKKVNLVIGMAYGEYLDYLRIGDVSGAELPEIEMWAGALAGIGLVFLSGFLASANLIGRRRRN